MEELASNFKVWIFPNSCHISAAACPWIVGQSKNVEAHKFAIKSAKESSVFGIAKGVVLARQSFGWQK